MGLEMGFSIWLLVWQPLFMVWNHGFGIRFFCLFFSVHLDSCVAGRGTYSCKCADNHRVNQFKQTANWGKREGYKRKSDLFAEALVRTRP